MGWVMEVFPSSSSPESPGAVSPALQRCPRGVEVANVGGRGRGWGRRALVPTASYHGV